MKKPQLGERSHYIIIISLFLILVNLTLGIFMIYLSREAMITQIQGRMLDIANTAADMLNGDDLKNLTKDDLDTKEYQDAIHTLEGFQNNIQLQYIYCIQQVGEKEFAFSIDPTKDDPGEFGEAVVYTDALYQASQGKAAVDREPYEDRWGSFYSAYSPVFDSQGDVAAIVAVDFSAEWFQEEVHKLVRTVMIVCGLSLLIGALIVVIIMEQIRRRNRQIYAELNALADSVEDLVNEVSITTHAEHSHPIVTEAKYNGSDISDLSEKIHAMQDSLRQEIISVRHMAYVDALTGVGNTAAYMQAVSRLNDQIRNGDAAFSIAAFDLNGLKKINDNFGHDNGDKALIDAVGVIVRVFGKEDVYRIGGDEFLAIVPICDKARMERLFDSFDKELEAENQKEKTYDIPISISKGCAFFDKEEDNEFKTVFRRADTTMYQDKDEFYERTGNGERR